MLKTLSIFCFLAYAWALSAQLPDTEIWLLKIEAKKSGLSIKQPLNISKHEGYDNQPVFSTDGKEILFVSVHEDKQADIYSYNLKNKKTKALTRSATSEYSPCETGDGKLISSVVVESDSAQCIHFIDKKSGIHERKVDLDSIGYYTFLNSDTLIYYKLTEPQSLYYYVINTRENKWLANHPTRSFRAMNRHTLIYAIKDTAKIIFYQYDFMLAKARVYAVYPSSGEDFIWHPVHGLVKSEGSRLLRFDEKEQAWKVLFDLSGFNLRKITRFGFDPKNKYLVVTENL